MIDKFFLRLKFKKIDIFKFDDINDYIVLKNNNYLFLIT